MQYITRKGIITTFKLANAYNGSLDILGIEHILQRQGTVKNYPRLHSKMYVFDDDKAIITSGNLTNGGLISNFEYGIFIDDKNLVSEIVIDFNRLSNSEFTGVVKKEHLSQAKTILSKIRVLPTTKFPNFQIETPETNYDIISDSTDSIISTLSGWKLEVFNCLNAVRGQELYLEQIYLFEQELQLRYPANNNVRAKIRQQLQNLRDLGLLEFLENGKYRKLWI